MRLNLPLTVKECDCPKAKPEALASLNDFRFEEETERCIGFRVEQINESRSIAEFRRRNQTVWQRFVNLSSVPDAEFHLR